MVLRESSAVLGSLASGALSPTSAQLLIRLTAALADKSLTEVLRRYAGWDLLLVD